MDQNNNASMPQKQPMAFAIASMVLGISAVFPGCCVYALGFILAILAIIFGGVSLSKKESGSGMAIAGLVLGILAIVTYIILIAVGEAVTAWMLSLFY